MSNFFRFCILSCTLLLSMNVFAGIQVDGVWARATAPGQDAAMVDLVILSSTDAKLTGFSSPGCKIFQIHRMTHENGVMKMREVQFIDLPAGKRLALGEQGYHLMLIGLTAPLKAGESLPLTLNIRTADKAALNVEVKAEIRPLIAHHMHH